MDRSARFWDRIAERYSKRPVSDEAGYEKKLQITRGYLRPNFEVMEFGCGTGSTAIALAPCVRHIVAIDISAKMIEIAQGKADADKVENVTFKRSTVEEYRAPDQTLDVVLGHNVLHLVEDWQEVIGRVHDILKPGGVFVSSTACLGDMAMFFKMIAPIGTFLGFFPSVETFTARELEESLTSSGFELDYRWQPDRNKAVFIVAKKKT